MCAAGAEQSPTKMIVVGQCRVHAIRIVAHRFEESALSPGKASPQIAVARDGFGRYAGSVRLWRCDLSDSLCVRESVDAFTWALMADLEHAIYNSTPVRRRSCEIPARGNPRFDSRQEFTRATQVRFVRSPLQGGPVALTVNREIELDAAGA